MDWQVVLYGSKSWSVTLRKEYKVNVSENRALRRIFGPKRKEVARDCRRLHNEELHNLYASSNIIMAVKRRMMRRAGHVARMGEIFWFENLKGRDILEDLALDGRIIIEKI
jgi:hypothetical protein